MRAPSLLLAALVACAPKTATVEPMADQSVRAVPAPLGEGSFTMPEIQTATLSNGLEVRLVRNTEVPLFDVRLIFAVGSDADPAGKEGLSSATMAMMSEGVSGMDAAALAAEARRLGGSVSAGAGDDLSALYVSGTVRNLEPLLDLWHKVLMKPTFPEDDWELMRARRIAALETSAENPARIIHRVSSRIVWGDAYSGRLTTEASYDAIQPQDMRAFHVANLRPDNAVVLAGGDIELDALVALLEKRLGSWKAPSTPAPDHGVHEPKSVASGTLYVVDKPGAAQSVVYATRPVGSTTAEDHWDYMLGTTVLGGAFTARMNMNLREDKGYTYGARCRTSHNRGPGVFYCSASVATPVTIPAFMEMRREIVEAVDDRPITQDELDFFKSFRVHSFQTSYETPSELLGEVTSIWTYDLPTDWLEQYVPGVQSVTVDSANAALRRWIQPDKMAWVIIGDVATFESELESLGLPMVRLDRDGNILETP